VNSEMAIDTEQHEQLQIAGALNVASDQQRMPSVSNAK